MQIVITTIFKPTSGAEQIASALAKQGGTLWVMGDRSGPAEYLLPATQFYDIHTQRALPFDLVKVLPEKHYTRKNLGYLLAIQAGARMLVETDDDNLPLPNYWQARIPEVAARKVLEKGWFNVYAAFGAPRVWPRGLPLESVNAPVPAFSSELTPTECLIQQGLANQNPDVDAVYRLVLPLPIDFADAAPIALPAGSWCPFNSQNTTWFEAAFPLLYLPSCCTFRMTDIWRSFVAQRCLWEMGSSLGFIAATMTQERNEHSLLNDFQQEIPGYLQNHNIRIILESLTLQEGRAVDAVCANLRTCYEALVAKSILPQQELTILNAWIADISVILSTR